MLTQTINCELLLTQLSNSKEILKPLSLNMMFFRKPRSITVVVIAWMALVIVSGCMDHADQVTATAKRFEGVVRNFEMLGPLVQNPELLRADALGIEDKASVIGVSVNGEHRAYRMQGMSMVETHVVNDVIQSVPVTVTYCDLRRCVRVFSKTGLADAPLNVRVGGFNDQTGLLLNVDGEVVPQAADSVPLTRLDATVMSWKEWKSAHPDTSVYLGREPDFEALNRGLKNLVLNTQGVKRPKIELAAKARIGDATKVIGVSVNGNHRAYRITALSDPRATVLNDIIANVPVTVTYNSWTDCVRVFVDRDAENEPLAVGLHGWEQGRMILEIDGKSVAQDSDEVDLEQLDIETVSWKAWKAKHPDTDIYTGMSQLADGAGD